MFLIEALILRIALIVVKYTLSNIFHTSTYVCYSFNNMCVNKSGSLEKLETTFLKCNFFRVYRGRSAAFLYSYSLLIYSQFTHEISAKRNLNLREKILDPQDTHQQKNCTDEIPASKNFRPTKYPRKKVLGPWNTHEKNFRPTKINFGPTKV